MDEPF